MEGTPSTPRCLMQFCFGETEKLLQLGSLWRVIGHWVLAQVLARGERRTFDLCAHRYGPPCLICLCHCPFPSSPVAAQRLLAHSAAPVAAPLSFPESLSRQPPCITPGGFASTCQSQLGNIEYRGNAHMSHRTPWIISIFFNSFFLKERELNVAPAQCMGCNLMRKANWSSLFWLLHGQESPRHFRDNALIFCQSDGCKSST